MSMEGVKVCFVNSMGKMEVRRETIDSRNWLTLKTEGLVGLFYRSWVRRFFSLLGSYYWSTGR